MKTKFLTLFCLASLATASALATPALEKLSEDDIAVAKKYLQLRMDYAKSDKYNPRPFYHGLVAEAMELFGQKKYGDVLEKLAPALEKDPYSVKLLPVKMAALLQLGKTNEAVAVREAYFGILHSIFITGDGQSHETAMRVISIDEEYAILQLTGLRPLGQALTTKDGHSYDVLTVRTPEGYEEDKTFDLYFNVDPLFKGSILGLLKDEKPAKPVPELTEQKQ